MITGEQAKYLKLAIEQFKSGISKGSSQGFSTRMQITPSSALRSALEIPLHIISDPFASAKGGMREFDRDIKDAEYLGARPKGGGYNREDGKKAVRSKFNEILIQASNINSKYFKPFMSLIDTKWNGIGKTPTELGKNLGIGSVNDINSDLNIDISELNDLSSSYEETNNPSNMILLYILPTMRKKFSALQTFSGTDFNSMFDKAISEQLSSSEISEIMDLYRAALEWAMFVDSLKSSNPIESGIENIANESVEILSAPEPEEPASTAAAPDTTPEVQNSHPEFLDISSGIYIKSVINPSGGFVDGSAYGTIGLVLDRTAFSRSIAASSSTPASFDLLIDGPMSGYISTSSAENEDYIEYFVSNNILSINNVLSKISWMSYISNISRSISSDGAIFTLFFDPYTLNDVVSSSDSGPIPFIKINLGNRGIFEVFADSTLDLKALYKISSGSHTTPYYETVSPSGERVFFTASDIVQGGGKIKDSKKRSFKPKSWKGKSLADRVNSKSYGTNVRGVRKKKK